jgi:hypothetical protein
MHFPTMVHTMMMWHATLNVRLLLLLPARCLQFARVSGLDVPSLDDDSAVKDPQPVLLTIQHSQKNVVCG